MGRSSMAPNRAMGCFVETSIASCMSRHSKTLKPVMASRVVANAPSEVRTSPFRTRIVLASSGEPRTSPCNLTPRASISSTHEVTQPGISSFSSVDSSIEGSRQTNMKYLTRAPCGRQLHDCTNAIVIARPSNPVRYLTGVKGPSQQFCNPSLATGRADWSINLEGMSRDRRAV